MNQPESTPKPPVRPNKRSSRRQAAKGNTKLRAYRNSMGLGPNIATAILDLSETGVRLLLKEDLPRGREFEIVLENVSSRSLKLLAEVAWSVPAADGTFCVGARLRKALSGVDLAVFARP